MSKAKKAVRFGKAKDARKKAADLWHPYIEAEHHGNFDKILAKLNAKDLEALKEIMTSVYQCDHRREKERVEHERKRKNSLASGNVP